MNFRYVPFHLLGKKKNIIVDGKGNEFTSLTLSHWPENTTPAQYKDDLSAQITFRFLEDPQLEEDVEVVSNNHFDEDGLVSLWSMLNPDEALSMKDFLVEVASAGDFSKCSITEAHRVAFVLSAWCDPERSPLSRKVFSQSTDELNQALYEELLKRFPNVISNIDNLVEFWKPEDDVLNATEKAIFEGRIKIEEDADLDLAIVTVPDKGILSEDVVLANPKSWVSSVLHPIAIHNKIDCFRVCVIQKNRYELYYRYETWIDFVSRILKERVDLSNLANRLNLQESSGGKWTFNGVDAIIGRLKLEGAAESSITPTHFIDYVRGAFTTTKLGIG